MMMFSGILVYTKDHAQKNAPFIERMLSEANRIGIKLELVYRDEIFIGVENGRAFVRNQFGEKINRNFAIIRCIDSLFTRHLEIAGFKTFNSAIVSELCNDKAKTCQLAMMLGIPTTDTIILWDDQIPPLRPPYVMKPRQGSGGTGVQLIENEATSMSGKQLIAQQLVTPGKDVRVFVIGKEVIGAVRRTSQTDFRANFTLGGDAELISLGDKERAMVGRLAQILEFGFVGIDFVYGENGDPLLNEIEDVVGSRTLSALSDIDAVQHYLQFIKRKLLE